MFACKCRVHQTVGVRSSNSPNSEQQKFQNLTISPKNLNNPNSEQTEQLVSSEQTEYRTGRTVRFEQTPNRQNTPIWPQMTIKGSNESPWPLNPTRLSPYPVAGPFWWPLIRYKNRSLSPTIPGIKLCCVKLKSRNSGVKWRKAKF